MYISKISIRNIRGFKELEVACKGNQTLIIGKNGTGKTTLLRAIVLGLSPEEDGRALLAEPIGEIVNYSDKTNFGEIVIKLNSSDKDNERDTFIHRDEYFLENEKVSQKERAFREGWSNRPLPEIWENWTGNIVVAGYGPGRAHAGSEAKSVYRIRDSVLSLFSYRTPLLSPELTLRRLQDYVGSTKYEATLIRIKQGLDLGANDAIELRRGGGIELSGPTIGRKMPLEAWADGYRLTFTWLIDLYGWAMQAGSIDENGHIHGVVLIDEIEQHLHPSLETGILPHLKQILPYVQIFATTHSPLVALGVPPESLVALRREGDKIVKEESLPDTRGYSAEDMLVEERLFDTPNVYAPETNEKLLEYQTLVEIPKEKRSAEQTDRLRSLAGELLEQQLPGIREPFFDPELKAILEKHSL